jgi:methionine--tRNA ligase beta chain
LSFDGHFDCANIAFPMVTLEEFKKLDIRLADVLEVTPHSNADRLYILTIQMGTERRQIVAGIRPFYTPEELIGKKVAVVANLEPAVVRGVESCGMLLAASDGTQLGVLTVDRAVTSGAVIK